MIFFTKIGDKNHFNIDLNDEVVRGSIILDKGKLLWPPPKPTGPPTAVAPKKTVEAVKAVEEEVSPFKKTLDTALVTTAGIIRYLFIDNCINIFYLGIGSIVGLGALSPNPEFTSMLTVLGLSGIVGYHTVWGVTPALHSPLMSVTNAISGITAVGGLLLMNGGYVPSNSVEVYASDEFLYIDCNYSVVNF